mgnify:CR=1 FL=1
MARSGETEIEMVQRHVREGEERVVRQREIVASLPPDSDLAATAHQLLTLFEETQESHREHLARLLCEGPETNV